MSSDTRNAFYARLANMSDENSTTTEILALVDLILYRTKKSDIATIHSIIGSDLLVELLYSMGGKTVTLPTVEEFREVFEWALCYYAREVQHREWKDIKAELGLDASAMKWSMKNKQLTQFMQEILHKKLSEQQVQEMLEAFRERHAALKDYTALSEEH